MLDVHLHSLRGRLSRSFKRIRLSWRLRKRLRVAIPPSPAGRDKSRVPTLTRPAPTFVGMQHFIATLSRIHLTDLLTRCISAFPVARFLNAESPANLGSAQNQGPHRPPEPFPDLPGHFHARRGTGVVMDRLVREVDVMSTGSLRHARCGSGRRCQGNGPLVGPVPLESLEDARVGGAESRQGLIRQRDPQKDRREHRSDRMEHPAHHAEDTRTAKLRLAQSAKPCRGHA